MGKFLFHGGELAQKAFGLAIPGADSFQLEDLRFEVRNSLGENLELKFYSVKPEIFCIKPSVFLAEFLEECAVLRGMDGLFVFLGRSGASGVICGLFEFRGLGSAGLRRGGGGEVFEGGGRVEVFDELLEVFKAGVHVFAVGGELLRHLLPVGLCLAESGCSPASRVLSDLLQERVGMALRIGEALIGSFAESF